MLADLHLHTCASDGQLSPTELIRLAHNGRLEAVAITDHDTTEGILEAQQAAHGSPVVIPGIELSAEDDGDVHTLGYFIDINNSVFQARLSQFREDRITRGEKIVARLAAMGKQVTWERVLAIADGGSIGRPHIAQAMVEAGYVNSVNEAFGKYLHNGGPAYVSRTRLSPEAAIDLIHAAGGVAVLAHPALVKDYTAMIERLVPGGLDGVEVIHPKNDDTVRANLRALARKHNLIITGGSDFHRPGTDFLGESNAPAECVHQLQERAARYVASG